MKKKNYFFNILFVLFIIFMALYIALESGYYDVKMGRKATITEEKLAEFEQDVKDGKEIDLKDYLSDDYVDYSSGVSRIGSSLGTSLDKIMDGGIDDFLKIITSLF
ncbi:MAG: hypothetical protein PUD34_05575 [bacterium]|nr:hypothetical protein [bacterium]